MYFEKVGTVLWWLVVSSDLAFAFRIFCGIAHTLLIIKWKGRSGNCFVAQNIFIYSAPCYFSDIYGQALICNKHWVIMEM